MRDFPIGPDAKVHVLRSLAGGCARVDVTLDDASTLDAGFTFVGHERVK